MPTSQSHRSTLKKDKKPFKSKHASKGQLKARNAGKVEKVKIKGKVKTTNKLQRKNLAKQLKENKVTSAAVNRKLFHSNNGVDKIVTIVTLTDDIDPVSIAKSIIGAGTGEDLVNIDSITSVKFSKFKSNFKFVIPDQSNILAILDAARISDFVVFGLSSQVEVEAEFGEQIIRAIELQGISNPVCVVPNIDTDLKDKQQKNIISSLTSYFKHFFPNEDRVYNLKSHSELEKVVHQLSSVIPKGVNWLSSRGYLVADDVLVKDDELIVKGTVRGAGFYVNQIIDIPNLGEYKIKYIEKVSNSGVEVIDDEVDVDEDESDLITLDDEEMETSDFEEGDDFDDFNIAEPADVEVEGEDYDPEIESILRGDHQTKAGLGNPDVELTDVEEKRQLDLFLEESENPGSSEEIHLNPLASGVERLKKFKFSTAEIDSHETDEKTPEEWDNMFKVKNFRLSTNKAFKLFNKKRQVGLGDKVILHIELTDAEDATDRMNKMDNFKSTPFVIFGLLKNETEKSLCNFTIKTWQDYEKPIASKDKIIVQYGSRREIIEPVYNGNSINQDNIHKYLKFSLPDIINIVSAIVPVNFGRAPAIFFKLDESTGALEFIGSGSFENIDHSRTVVKRALLVGQPFKIHKKVITIRYMFFNPQDINFFKSVPLFTKSGASGYIKESLGTHGYFKASFNRKLSAQDYVYMALYKRVWPKVSQKFINI